MAYLSKVLRGVTLVCLWMGLSWVEIRIFMMFMMFSLSLVLKVFLAELMTMKNIKNFQGCNILALSVDLFVGGWGGTDFIISEPRCFRHPPDIKTL